MRLLSCRIENFGKLSDREFFFDDLTVIKEDNSYGKTTLAAFIGAMFYGFQKRGERDAYKPWQGGLFGGTLNFSIGTRTYRVDRDFNERNDGFRLTDTVTKRAVEKIDDVYVDAKNLGEAIFGINKDSYERSAFVPQGDIVSHKIEGGLNEKLRNVINATDENHNYGKAVEILSDAAKLIDAPRARTDKLREVSARISELNRKIDECAVCAENVGLWQGELNEMREKLAENKEEIAKLEKQTESQTASNALRQANERISKMQISELENDKAGYEDKINELKAHKPMGKILFILACVFTLGIYYFLAAGKAAKLQKALSEAEEGLRRTEREIELCKIGEEAARKDGGAATEELYRAKEQKDRERTELIREITSLENRIAAADARAGDSGDYESERAACIARKQVLVDELEIIRETKRFLTEANDNLANEYLTPLREKSRGLIEMFDGDKSAIEFDADGDVTIEEKGRERKLEFFSTGNRELISICMRFALVETIFKNVDEIPCVILDDPFVNLDDKKLETAKELVKSLSENYQIIYLTCHDSRKI